MAIDDRVSGQNTAIEPSVNSMADYMRENNLSLAMTNNTKARPKFIMEQKTSDY